MNSLIALYSPVPQSGKSTVADTLKYILNGKRASFASPLRDMVVGLVAPFFGGGEAEVREWLSDGRKDYALIPQLGVTLRSMLQTGGTDWGRNMVHPELWSLQAKELSRKVRRTHDCIFDDMRFENEYALIRKEEGTVIKIVRAGAPEAQHESEGRLEGLPFDFVIENNGTLEELRRKVAHIAFDMWGKGV